MQITVTKNSDGKLEVQPADEALKMALNAIRCWSGFDELVTKALRRVGYGGDYFGINYPGDMEEKEVATTGIRDGQVLTYDFDDKELFLEGKDYLRLLQQVCLLKGMDERANLLERYITDPLIANDLLEADAKACNERWKRFVPFLQKNGWILEGRMIGAPNYGMTYNAEIYDGDLDVMFRKTQKSLKHYTKNEPSDPNCVIAHRLMLKSLCEFFTSEK